MRSSRDALTWTLVGAAAGLTLLGLFSIAVFMLPLTLLLAVAAGRATNGAGAYGAAVGAGLVIAAVCLPQGLAGLGAGGLAVVAAGVAACVVGHRRAA